MRRAAALAAALLAVVPAPAAAGFAVDRTPVDAHDQIETNSPHGVASASGDDITAAAASTLSAASLTPTSAELVLTGHAGSWWVKQTAPSAGNCTPGEADYSHALSGLAASTAYTYKAYSATGCGAAAEIVGVTFTTPSPADRKPGEDVSTLSDAGNDAPKGVWSDGTTVWVADADDDKVYAYKLSDGSRDAGKDFTTLSAAGNGDPWGLWSDGVTMWVLDWGDDKIYAYKMSDKSRDASKDFTLSAASGNTGPIGLWSDGVTMWVLDWGDDKIYAYKMSDRSRDASKDFNTLFATGGSDPVGLWSDGVTMWAADGNHDKVYAYRMSDGSRDAGKDFATLSDAGNNYPVDLWSDGATMWVADGADGKLYAYHAHPALVPSGIAVVSATLELTGYAGAWWVKQTSPGAGICTAGESDYSHALSGLTGATAYTYKAYSSSDCGTGDEIVGLAFTTADPSALSVSDVTQTTATLTISNYRAKWWHKRTTPAAAACTEIAASTSTASLVDLTASTAYTYTAYDESGCSAADKIDSVSFTAAAPRTLTATDVTHASATLTIANHSGDWYHRQTQPSTGTCSSAVSAAAASLEGLSGSTSYTWKAYGDSTCSDDIASASFTTSPTPSDPGGSNLGGSNPGGGSPGGGSPGSGGSGAAKPIRVSGSDRYATAAAAANQFVALLEQAPALGGAGRHADTVIVASGEAFPDALAASALARTLEAPVVLTPHGRLDAAVKSFVVRNRISKVVIVGGPAAVSDRVAEALRALSGVKSVERHAGPDRYATAARIAQAVGTPGNLCGSTTPTVIVTTGQDYPDALVAGPLAYRGRHPIVLTARDRLPAATAEYLRTSGAKQAVIVGGLAAVSEAVADAVEALGLATSRVSGSDRADTSAQFARRFNANSGPSCYRRDTVGLATGWAFPDALAAAALLGRYGAPLLLTDPKGVPEPLIDYAASGKLQPDFDQPPIVTIGGRNAVPSDHPTKLLAALPR